MKGYTFTGANMTKRAYTEKAFRDALDCLYPTGITSGEDFYRSAKDLEPKDNPLFRELYHYWLDSFEREGIDTGIYL